jgi:hypothetical protein
MKKRIYILSLFFLILISGCVTPFTPDITDDKDLLVVEGLITDQSGPYTVKLSRSLPVGNKKVSRPMKGCAVTVHDNVGNTFLFKEGVIGTYTSDNNFQAVVGRTYTLHINTTLTGKGLQYESRPMEMKPVPSIDSIFYEKLTLGHNEYNMPFEGAQVYLNTHDPSDRCKYYRWDYTETWEIKIPYPIKNDLCYVTNNSVIINIKNVSILGENKIDRLPVNFISNETDRLSRNYSILVNQYSLNEIEYQYWDKLQAISGQIGGLYDITPSSIPSNVNSLSDDTEKVLGFFSVSAESSKRIFIKEWFKGLAEPYKGCVDSMVVGEDASPTMGWILYTEGFAPSIVKFITYDKGCTDCTIRGTTVRPAFWKD